MLINKAELIRNFSFGNIIFFSGRVLTVSAATFFVMLTCRVLGNWFCDLFGLNFKDTASFVVEMATGIMLVTTILFLLGLVSMLNWFAVSAVFLIIIFLRWKKTLSFLKALVKPIAIPKDLNWLGAIGVVWATGLATLLGTALEILAVQRVQRLPYPWLYGSKIIGAVLISLLAVSWSDGGTWITLGFTSLLYGLILLVC